MNVETLVVTTGQSDNHLPQQMHIQTDALIGNQCGKDSLSEHVYLGHKIRYINTSTHGVGINRNEVLMRATGDICVLADDDMVFLDGYEKTICTWFQKLPQADILLLNLEGGKARHRNTKVTRITTMNYGKYGAARIAFRREAVHFSGVMFHTMFGGGCRYSCGEDTLFCGTVCVKVSVSMAFRHRSRRLMTAVHLGFKAIPTNIFRIKGFSIMRWMVSGDVCTRGSIASVTGTGIMSMVGKRC